MRPQSSQERLQDRSITGGVRGEEPPSEGETTHLQFQEERVGKQHPDDGVADVPDVSDRRVQADQVEPVVVLRSGGEQGQSHCCTPRVPDVKNLFVAGHVPYVIRRRGQIQGALLVEAERTERRSATSRRIDLSPSAA